MMGGGDIGRHVRDTDWSQTPLGAYATWPQSLRSCLSTVLNTKGVAALFWGAEQRTLYNDACATALGDRHSRAFGQPLPDALADTVPALVSQVAQVLTTGEGMTVEDFTVVTRRQGRDETAAWTYSISPIQGERGNVAGAVLLATETTQQRRVVEALKESEARLSGLLRTSSEVLYSMNPDWSEMSQLAGGGFLADTATTNPNWLADYIPAADQTSVKAAIAEAIRTATPFRFQHRVRRADGSLGWIESRAVPLLDAQGNVTEWFGAANDVTARRQAEIALQESERTLRLIVEAATDYAILTISAGRIVTSWSAGAEAIFGFSREAIVGQSVDMLFTPEDREAGQPQKEIDGARQMGGAPDVRWHLRQDGSRVFLNGVVRPLRDAAGHEIGFLKIARDETERLAAEKTLRDLNATLESRVDERSRELMAAEEAMRQSQKMEAVGQLTGGVAHDFNNLLTIIRSSVDLLRRPDLTSERRRRYIDAVSDTVDRAAKLTGQLLAFARRQALKPEVFDVGARLRGVGEMLDTVTGARIRVVTELPDEPCFVRADLSQFETALVNMAVNARDAMEGDGVLTIRLRCGTTMPPIRGHAGAAGPFAAVSLSDTGTGIDEQRIARIFEPFFTTKEVGKGTGLGLSQVFGFTKQSGGDVEVESEVGRGTTFTLYLPEVEADANATVVDRPSDTLSPGGAGRRVLVVEDNVEVGRFSTQVLQDLGYETTWAANAEEALDKIGERGADFDVVFSDVVMPGMGGIELAKQLRRRLPDLPVILASGYSHILAEEGTHGFDLLHKPYSAEQLSRTLRRVTRQS